MRPTRPLRVPLRRGDSRTTQARRGGGADLSAAASTTTSTASRTFYRAEANERQRVREESDLLLRDAFTDEARVRRLRREADRQGLKLRKSRARPGSDEFGTFSLIEARTIGTLAHGTDGRGVMRDVSLDEIDSYLASLRPDSE